MVDKASDQAFTASISSLDGTGGSYSANLPPYVLDKTVRDVMEGLVTAISKSDKDNVKGLQGLSDLYKEAMTKEEETTSAVEDLGEKMDEAEKQAA